MHEPGALRWQFCKRKRNKERKENRKGKNLRTEGRKAGMCGRVSVGACGGAYIRVCMSVDRQKKHGIKKAKTKTAIKETHTVTRENAASRKEAGEDGKSEEKVGITCLCFSSRSEERRP